jgi:pyruvate dehydrogenase E2 component (dihydrolipoamide acetyltransferase)
VAILGVSRGQMEPVWTGDAFEPRLMLPLSLSYDHRVIDGADAMRFLRWVADALEQPFLLSLHG